MPTLPIEREITWLLKQYSDIYKGSVYAANKVLADCCMEFIDKYPFKDILYIYKQVLIRYQLEVSIDYVQAAKNLKIKRSTLAQMRSCDKGKMNDHMPFGGF